METVALGWDQQFRLTVHFMLATMNQWINQCRTNQSMWDKKTPAGRPETQEQQVQMDVISRLYMTSNVSVLCMNAIADNGPGCPVVTLHPSRAHDLILFQTSVVSFHSIQTVRVPHLPTVFMWHHHCSLYCCRYDLRSWKSQISCSPGLSQQHREKNGTRPGTCHVLWSRTYQDWADSHLPKPINHVQTSHVNDGDSRLITSITGNTCSCHLTAHH